MPKIKVGPILGLESDTQYTVCFSTDKNVAETQWAIDGKKVSCQKVGNTPSSTVWKAVYKVSLGNDSKNISYQILIDGEGGSCKNKRDEWYFYSPGKRQDPKFAYMSCNGFSSLDLMHKTQEPYGLWEKMLKQNQDEPLSLMLMGGDQLYGDSIWSSVPELKKWNDLPHDKKISSRPVSKTLCDQIDRFYDTLYQERWNTSAMSLMLATVPSVMMWDDHDIFDGWGSFPSDIQNCSVFQQIFKTAKSYFEIFQIRSKNNVTLLDKDAGHYAFALEFRGYHILALDNRSERTLGQVMSHDSQWPLLNDYLQQLDDGGHLLVLSGVPVVYRDFSSTESVFDATPWEEELTDDLKDHWRSKNHQGERARLIHRILDSTARRAKINAECKTVILSGDVHIGCLGVIHNQTNGCKIHQVVSSGIVHPAPSRLQWIGIMAVTNDRPEYLDENREVHISMLKPFASDQYIRCRNYITLSMGSDKKLWVNWESEGKDKPYYPIQ
ncbi:MAG: alkaline phosphatase D family protein [Porticoccus sp.]|nr:alkaline phosphatase D family protein [Porticoccus sp.]